VLPTSSTEEAVKLVASLGREDTLLGGERKGLKIEGFDLGNSPLEYVGEEVEGKQVVMTTTNWTPALRAADEAARVLVCAFTNLTAVACSVVDDTHVVVQCAGREGRFSFEDALCAGHLLLRIRELKGAGLKLNDPARAACALAERIDVSVEFLRGTAAGLSIDAIGLADDLIVCADVDRHAIVPRLRDGTITVIES
jgi:2-phosphosulfolactate phosphatase